MKKFESAGFGRNQLRLFTAATFILSVLICFYGWRKGLFTSEEAMRDYISGLGTAGPLVFVVFQAVQVVFPILPGGIGCLAGVILFGALKGFLYNYAGICAGSVAAFLVARHCGQPILDAFFSQKQIQKYEHWTEEKDRFTRLFAIAIFLPVAPDDFLCYLAGTTKMRLSTFTLIILLGKPAAIALYSLGLSVVFRTLSTALGLAW